MYNIETQEMIQFGMLQRFISLQMRERDERSKVAEVPHSTQEEDCISFEFLSRRPKKG